MYSRSASDVIEPNTEREPVLMDFSIAGRTCWVLTWLLLGCLCQPCCRCLIADESTAKIEELQEQLQEQSKRIQQLEADVADQRELLQRLPVVDPETGATATEESRDGAAAQAEEGGSSPPSQEVLLRLDRLEQSLLGVARRQIEFLDAAPTESTRVLSGRIHVDSWGFPEATPGINELENGNPADAPLDRLLYRRIRFGVRGTIPPNNMSYRVEIEFSGQDGSQFRDAWIGWDEIAYLGTVRFGNQKRPYGWDYLNSSNFTLFLERPFIVEALNEDNRRFGLAVYDASDDLAFNWQYGVFDLDIIQSAGSSLNNNYPFEFAWRVANTYWYDETSGGRGYGHLGLSGTFAFPNPDPPTGDATDSRARFRTRPEGRSSNRWMDTGLINGGSSYQILGVETVVNVGRFQFAGELMEMWLQRLKDYGPNLHMHGGYCYLSYFLTGEHIPWNRELGILGRVEPFEDFFLVSTCERRVGYGLGAWEVACRFSYGDLNDQDIFGGYGRSATLALNWYWNARARLQLNYIFGRIDDSLASQAIGGPAVVSGSYQISGLRAIIDF